MSERATASTPQSPSIESERTRVHRRRERAAYDRDAVYAVLDRGLVAHVGFVDGGTPFVLPMAYARVDDTLLLHGSTRARMLEAMAAGIEVCASVTLLDGLVLARSAFRHSMNYRSVTVLGRAEPVADPEAKRAALAAFVDRLLPGRSREVRAPDDLELRATAVLALPILEAAAKVRTGGPSDDPADLSLPVWAGVIPLALTPGVPEADRLHTGATEEGLARVHAALAARARAGLEHG